jgi:poly-gamma-glutamate synthesis protein (capsule biosynthesis protein)
MKPIYIVVIIFTFTFGIYLAISQRLNNASESSYNLEKVKEESKVSKKVSLLAFGDVMLDRQVRTFMNKNGLDYPFSHIGSFMSSSDITFVNLEGAITSSPSKTSGVKNADLVFTFDTKTAPLLAKYGVDIVSLANNHSYNFGISGLNETKQNLIEAGVKFFGDPFNKSEISSIVEVDGFKIAFIGYHEFYNQDYSFVLEEIREKKTTSDFVVVSPHWGQEYYTKIPASNQELAREFIDAGANLVLGTHPHVIQPIEIYNNGVIFYSLGNFIFDQDFSFNTTHGLAVRLVLTIEDGLIVEEKYDLVPISVIKSIAKIADKISSDIILARLSSDSLVREEIKQGILTGSFIKSQ